MINEEDDFFEFTVDFDEELHEDAGGSIDDY